MKHNIIRLLVVGLLVTAFILYGRWSVERSRNEARAQRISCVNNMEQIGLAFRVWAGDNGEQYPFNVRTNAGGTMELCARDKDGFDSNVALHLRVMSNELNTPFILICPKDNLKKRADTFGNLTRQNVTYRLRTGTNITDANPKEIFMVCPIDGNILHCDGTVESKAQDDYDPDGSMHVFGTNAPSQTFGMFAVMSNESVAPMILYAPPGSSKIPSPKIKNAAGRDLIPKDVLNILENADKFTLFSLEPEPLFVPESLKTTNSFHGYPVLGNLEIHDPKQRNENLNALYPSVSKDAPKALCFNPRHGIHVRLGKNVEDLVICFECGQIYFYGLRDGKLRVFGTPASAFNRVLSDAHVPLSKQTPGE